MTARILFVSVNKSFDSAFNLADLEPWVDRAWAMTVAKASTCDRVVAVYQGFPVACWRIRFAFPSEDTYRTTGGERQRVALSLGEPFPVLSEFLAVPSMRHGAATADLDVSPLSNERDESVVENW